MLKFAEEIGQQALALGWVDWTVTITALVYVFLAARQQISAWWWGIVSCGLWAYASFVFYQLYLDALLQLFYVGMGFAGLYQWRYGKQGKLLPVSRMNQREQAIILVTGTALAIPFGYFFDNYTQAAATYWDAFTTIFAVLATILLVQKKLENWLYWVVIDAIYVGLYASRGAYLFSAVMVVYVVIAGRAFLSWRREIMQPE